MTSKKSLTAAAMVAAAFLTVGAVAPAAPAAPAALLPPVQSACDLENVEYSVAANLQVTGTEMGAGDGVYSVGPGRIVLQFDRSSAVNAVRMIEYVLPQNFTITTHLLFWKTSVATHADAQAIPPSATIAEGTFDGSKLRWSGPGSGFRAEGTITCEGTFCGKFGAPPPGTSPLHERPHALDLKAFEFAKDQRTFTMPYTLVSKSDSPKQRTFLALGAREVRRTCAVPRSAEASLTSAIP